MPSLINKKGLVGLRICVDGAHISMPCGFPPLKTRKGAWHRSLPSLWVRPSRFGIRIRQIRTLNLTLPRAQDIDLRSL